MKANTTAFLTEAFQELNMLNEETFDVTDDGIKELDKFSVEFKHN